MHPLAEEKPAGDHGFAADVGSRAQGMSFELSLLLGLVDLEMVGPLKASSDLSPVRFVAVQEQHLLMQLKPVTVATVVAGTS